MSTVEPINAITSGDRPSGNIRGTRSPAVGRHGMIATSQTLASAAGLEGAAGRRQRDRRRRHRRRGARRGRAEHERHRRRPARASSTTRRRRRSTASTRAAARRTRPRRRSIARRGLTRDARPRPARRRRARRRRRLAPAADALRHDHARARRSRRRSRYARDGFPVAEMMADEWQRQRADARRRSRDRGDVPARRHAAAARARSSRTRGWRDRSSAIAKDGRDAFYTGSIARAIVADMQARDGLLELRDFADHQADWVEPICDELSRLRRARDAAEHAGVRRARDAEHPGGLRHHGAGPQHRRLPARGHRSQADRVRRSRRLSWPIAITCRRACCSG